MGTQAAIEKAMQASIVAPSNELGNDALAQAVQKRPDGSALLCMHEAMCNLVKANGDVCKVHI